MRAELLEGGQGDQALAVALEVQRWLAVDQNQMGAADALELPGFWPAKRGAVRVGRIRRGENMNRWSFGRYAFGAQAINRPWQRELGRPEAFDKVTTPDLARFLHRAKHRVYRREPAWHAFAQHGLARDHAVSLEQLQCSGVRGFGGRRRGLEQRCDQ